MKAILHTRYGPPEVLRIADLPKPVPGEKEILIEVHASTVNRTDCGFLRGKPLIVRFFSGLFRPKNKIPGSEFAGVVEAIGKSVTFFQAGDRVFGFSGVKFGTHAGYLVMPEDGPMATIPDHMSFLEAAPMTEGAHYALNDIRAANVRPGQNVLIYGATGAIGSAAVQLTKASGAEVTAVCNSQNVDLVKSLGADRVIDYEREDFTKIPARFDFVFDAVGKSRFGKCKPLLREGGTYISTDLGPRAENLFYALWTRLFGGKKLLFPIPKISKEIVIYLSELARHRKFKPIIDRSYPLEQIAEAFKYVETGQKTGNVVIAIEPPADGKSV